MEDTARPVPGIQRQEREADRALSPFCAMVKRMYIVPYYHFHVDLYGVVLKYSRINSAKCPASGAGNVSEPRLMSQAR